MNPPLVESWMITILFCVFAISLLFFKTYLLASYILNYLAYLNKLKTKPQYFLPSGKSVFGHYVILPNEHLSAREVVNIVRSCTETWWPHLARETVASDIIRKDPSIIAAFKVQRRLDLESYETGFNYLRRFASDVIENEGFES